MSDGRAGRPEGQRAGRPELRRLMRIGNLIKVLLLLLGIGLLLLIVILAGPSRIWGASKEVNLTFILSGLMVFALYLFVRSLRWHVMLKVIKDDVRLRDFMPFIISLCLNIIRNSSSD